MTVEGSVLLRVKKGAVAVHIYRGGKRNSLKQHNSMSGVHTDVNDNKHTDAVTGSATTSGARHRSKLNAKYVFTPQNKICITRHYT